MLFNRDSAISQCFCLHWHLDSELCIRNSWAGHKRRAMGGKEAGIHHECLPCAECQAFSDIWLSLILITCKERVDDTRSTDGQFPASQSVQLVQSKVDWKQKKRSCNLHDSVCTHCVWYCFQGSMTERWYECSWNTSLALRPWKIRGPLYSLTFSERLLSPHPENLFRVAKECPTLPDHKIESHRGKPEKSSLSSQFSLDNQVPSSVWSLLRFCPG